MREKWARRIVVMTALIVVLLAFVFARLQNPTRSVVAIQSKDQSVATVITPADTADLKQVAAGRRVYEQQSCALCHSIGGQGKPQNSLDGVGLKYSVSELRGFITGAETLKDVLPESIRKMKQRYANLSEQELGALLSYMQSLR